MTASRLIDVRGFLEGIEIPVISGLLQIAEGAPAILQVQVVGTDRVLDLLDRTVIHLFFSDRVNEPKQNLEDYSLFFSGEVRGFEITKEVGMRSAVLTCEDCSAYWDVCYQYFANFSSGGDGFWDRTSAFFGANKQLFDNVLRNPEMVLGQLIKSRSITRPETQGLLSGVIRLFEAVGGVYHGNKLLRGMNDFLSQAELRLRNIEQLGVAEKDTTSARLMNNKLFLKWITNNLGSYGGVISYRDMLKILFGYIFHNVAPNPIAYYVPGSSSGAKEAQDLNFMRSIAIQHLGGILKSIRLIKKTVQSAIDTGICTEEQHNLIQSQIQSLEPALKSAKENTQVPGYGKYAASDHSMFIVINKHVASAKSHIAANDYVSTKYDLDAIERFTVNLKVEPLEKVTTSGNFNTKRSFLFTQLIYPNLFFAPPPRCNVIFPDQYTSFSYKRDFRREITRLRMQLKSFLDGPSRDLGRGAQGTTLIGRYWYAPDIKSYEDTKFLRSTEKQVRVLLPHEKFSGIIPSLSEFHRVNLYAARQDDDYKSAAGNIAYVQRVTNYKFFLDRFSARIIQVSGSFNYTPVCGLPILVLDRYQEPYCVAGTTDARPPTQYLGRLVQLSHALSPMQCNTSLAISEARTQDETGEILGANMQSVMYKAKESKGRKQATKEIEKEVAILRSRSLPGLAESVGVSLTNQEVLYALDGVQDSLGILQQKADGKGLTIAQKTLNRAHAAIGDARKYIRTNQVVLAKAQINLATTILSTINNFDVVEDAIEEFPFEDVVRPAWYAPLYDNSKIGNEYYNPLLGCKSIVDTTSVTFEEDPLGELSTNSQRTVQGAVNRLVEIYGSVRRSGGDTAQFAFDYTARPVAALYQIFEEFHHKAFGDTDGFMDFLTDPTLPVRPDAIKRIDSRLDPRKERRAKVREYVDELQNKALIG